MKCLARMSALCCAGSLSLACNAGEEDPPAIPESGGTLSDSRDETSPYAFLRRGGIGYDELSALWSNLPYASISLSREACFGTCPQYDVTFRRGSGEGDGTASYVGHAYVSREGSFEGAITIWDYARLCELLDHLGFRALRERYAASWTDDATTVLSADHVSGSKRVSDYGDQGPPELFALQLAVDATAEVIEWTSVESDASP